MIIPTSQIITSDTYAANALVDMISCSGISSVTATALRPTFAHQAEMLQRSSVAWPECKQALSEAEGSVVLQLAVDTESEALPTKRLEVARQWTAAWRRVMAEADAHQIDIVAVHWQPGNVIHSRNRLAHLLGCPDGDLEQYTLWIGLDWMRDESTPPRVALRSAGANFFFGSELEILPTYVKPSTLAIFLLSTLKQMIEAGLVLKPGETLGFDKTALFRVEEIVTTGDASARSIIRLRAAEGASIPRALDL